MVCRLLLGYGAWRSLASASALGAEGRRFESCRPDQKRRVFLGNEKGFFVSTWGDWARTCEQAGLTECFRDGRSARKIRRRRSNPVEPTKKEEPFSATRRAFLCHLSRFENESNELSPSAASHHRHHLRCLPRVQLVRWVCSKVMFDRGN